MKLSAWRTGLGMAGMKEELTTGLLLFTKLAAELANGLDERGGS